MCERSVLRLLRKTYPSIYEELTRRPSLLDLDRIDDLLDEFCRVKGFERSDVYKNREQSRMVFITIAVKAYDPMFFVDQDKALMRQGLREKLSETLYCHKTQISHTLSTVRTYLRVYKSFREEVDYIYSKTVNQIIDESKN